MSYSLNSLRGGHIGDYIGTTIGVIKGDTRSLGSSSYTVGAEGLMPTPSRQREDGHKLRGTYAAKLTSPRRIPPRRCLYKSLPQLSNTFFGISWYPT